MALGENTMFGASVKLSANGAVLHSQKCNVLRVDQI